MNPLHKWICKSGKTFLEMAQYDIIIISRNMFVFLFVCFFLHLVIKTANHTVA